MAHVTQAERLALVGQDALIAESHFRGMAAVAEGLRATAVTTATTIPATSAAAQGPRRISLAGQDALIADGHFRGVKTVRAALGRLGGRSLSRRRQRDGEEKTG